MKRRTCRKAEVLISTVVVMVFTLTAAGKTVYVDYSATGVDNGSSWDNAYNFLQNALATTEYGDEIRVARGTYTPDSNSAVPNGTGDREATFELVSGVTLKGGYAGPSEPDPNARDVTVYKTILSGDLSGDDAVVDDASDLLTEFTRAENSYHVVAVGGVDANTALDGFMITAGRADGSYPYDRGGGMYSINGYTVVSNCVFNENAAALSGGGMHNWGAGDPKLLTCEFNRNSAKYGGAMYNWVSSPRTEDCVFTNNIAEQAGGAIINWDNSAVLANCTFTGNRAMFFGGGLTNNYNDSSISNCAFHANSAGLQGGAMDNYYSNPVLDNCALVRNSSFHGGGMYNAYSNPILRQCSFSTNSAEFFGGGIYNGDYSSPTLRSCAFRGNSSGQGGGIFNQDSSPTLMSCILIGNSSEQGGGMFGIDSSIILRNCTFGDNSANFFGGSLCSDGSYITLSNCISWRNSAKLGLEIYLNSNHNVSVSFCNIQGGWESIYASNSPINWGPGNIDEEPLLTPDGHLRSGLLRVEVAGTEEAMGMAKQD